MKKLTLILLVSLLPLLSYSQKVNAEDFKDYKPCTECMDNWKKTSSIDFKKPNIKSNSTFTLFKTELKTTRTIIMSMVTLAITSAIIISINKHLTDATH